MFLPDIQTSSKPLFTLLYSSYIPKIINAAINIDLFEALGEGPMTLSTLSERLGSHIPVTDALLNVLAAVELVTRENGYFSLTMTAENFLLKGSAVNQIAAVREYSGSEGPFDSLVQTLRNGPDGFDGKYWGTRQAVLDMEQKQRGGAIQAVRDFMKTLPSFATARSMCDFAGNIGYFSFALMQENPGLFAHVYELPEVCALARELKEKEENFNRIHFHEVDTEADLCIDQNFDLFFCSHYLYRFNTEDTLPDFLERVSRSLTPGGLFISHHLVSDDEDILSIPLSLVELMTRSMGYPTHQLPEEDLKAALTRVGFGEFQKRRLDAVHPYPVLLLSAIKQDG